MIFILLIFRIESYAQCISGDCVNGKGIFENKTIRYDGEFKNKKFEGFGNLVFKKGKYRGDRYEGNWIAGKRNGQGTYNFSDGESYLGEWRKNKRHGKGKYDFMNGDTYDGSWVNDRMEGQGIYIYGSKSKWNGDKYVGEWLHNKWNGSGEYFYTNGDIYVGQFRGHKKEGKGKYIFSNGTFDEGIWKNDELILKTN